MSAPPAPKVKFQLMSDLHLHNNVASSGYRFEVVPKAPYLLLPGDIGAIGWGQRSALNHEEEVRKWLVRQCSQFEKVIMVAGNHEFRGNTIKHTDDILKSWENDAEMLGRFIYLSNTSTNLEDRNGKVLLTLVGGTMWTEIRDDQRRYFNNDFQRNTAGTRDPVGIVGDYPGSHNARFRQFENDIRFHVGARRALNPTRKLLVMTHHAPAIRGTAAGERDGKDAWSHYQADVLGGEGVEGLKAGDVWVFGHTHWNVDYIQDEVRLIANQRGRINEEARPRHNRFDGEFTFEM